MSDTGYSDAVQNFVLSQKLKALLGSFPEMADELIETIQTIFWELLRSELIETIQTIFWELLRNKEEAYFIASDVLKKICIRRRRDSQASCIGETFTCLS